MELDASDSNSTTSGLDSEPSILTDPIMTLRNVIRFDSDLDYYSFLLWDAQTYMRDVLPADICLYLAFSGKKSSGKTTATRAAAFLACNGKMIVDTTPAALRRTCGDGITMGIDEVDSLSKTNEQVQNLLRVGNAWNAKAQLTQPKGNGHEVIEINAGGPKVFNFRGEIDDALRTRCIVISMSESKDAGLSINALFLENELIWLKGWLESDVKAHLHDWDQWKVQEAMRSDEFLARVKGIDPELARGYQQAAILLIISDIMGWGLDDRIKSIIESQESEDPFEAEKEIIANWWLGERNREKERFLTDPVAMVQTSSEELRAYVNQDLKARNLKEVSKHRFSVLKRELGFKEGVNAKKSSAQRGKTILTFDEIVLKNLGVWNQT